MTKREKLDAIVKGAVTAAVATATRKAQPNASPSYTTKALPAKQPARKAGLDISSAAQAVDVAVAVNTPTAKTRMPTQSEIDAAVGKNARGELAVVGVIRATRALRAGK